MGRKKPAAARGTWVLLAEVVGRLCPPILPATLAVPAPLWMPPPPPRRDDGGACDHLRFVPDCAVPMEEGREGGRPGSPAGPVMPRMRLPAELRLLELECCATTPERSASAEGDGEARAACSSCATGGFDAELVVDTDSSAGGVVIVKVRRWRYQKILLLQDA